MSKKSSYYVKNKDLLVEIKDYNDNGVMSEELGKMILTIATNYSDKGSFSGYSWKRDMIADAVFTCVKYIHNFDPDKQKHPNPFAYITTICHNAFVNYIRKQKKHSKIKDVCYNKMAMLVENENYVQKGINYESLK